MSTTPNLRVVYVGPSMSGRRTSLASVLRSSGARSNALTIDPHADHEFTLGKQWEMTAHISSVRSSFSYQSIDEPDLGPNARLELDWLCDADGIIFVIDSQRARLPAARDEFAKLTRDLANRGLSVDAKPIVFQANKRDCKDVMALAEIRSAFSVRHCSYVESIATNSTGPSKAATALANLILDVRAT